MLSLAQITPLADLSQCSLSSFFSIHFIITLHSYIAATSAPQYKKKLKLNKMLSILVIMSCLAFSCPAISHLASLIIRHFHPPHLHLTTSKVMVIVWRLRGNIIRTVLCIANVLPLQSAQLTKTVHTARLGLEFDFVFFWGCMIYLYVHVCFVLPWTIESFPFVFWRWRNKLK